MLNRVYSWLRGAGAVRYFAKREDVTTGGECHTFAQLERAINALDKFDLYLTLNPSVWRSIKARRADITAFNWMVLDLDPPPGAVVHSDAIGALWDGIDAVVGKGYNPVLVHTGRGVQFWLPISGASGFEPSDWDWVTKRITAEIAKAATLGPFVLDLSCAEVSRVVRCPGTTNHKNGAKAHLLHPVVGDPVPIDFVSLLDRAGTQPAPEPVPSSGDITFLNPSSLRFIYTGANGYTESRHRRLYSTALNLKEVGFGREAAQSWLWFGCERTRPRFEEGDSAAIDKVLNQLWR